LGADIFCGYVPATLAGATSFKQVEREIAYVCADALGINLLESGNCRTGKVSGCRTGLPSGLHNRESENQHERKYRGLSHSEGLLKSRIEELDILREVRKVRDGLKPLTAEDAKKSR